MLPDPLDIVEHQLRARLAASSGAPFILGICGAQGSGKSTVALGLQERLEATGQKVAVLSLDDLYLTKAERRRLGESIHPLFRTRGVPGTHDIALGEAVLEGLGREGVTRMPRFDKRRDTRLPHGEWQAVDCPVDVVVFEGWCVGALPEPDENLATPINRLERDEDPDGSWRRRVNAALGRDYPRLFYRIDMLVLLAAPTFDVVAKWRIEQESTLRKNLQANGQSTLGLMTDAQIERFVLFYERLTRHIIEEMPSRADVVIRLNAERKCVSLAIAAAANLWPRA